MPELRWILLALGVLLIGTLYWWDRRRHTLRSSANSADDARALATRQADHSPQDAARVAAPLRESRRALPVIEFNDEPVGDTHSVSDSPSGARWSGVTVMQGHAVDVPGASVAGEASESVVSGDATTIVEANPPQSYQATRPAKILLDWPPEKERRLVSVRVVAQRPDGAAADAAVEARLSGAHIRQALAAEGFWHGKFDIFHMPLPDGRVVLSAAGLTQPGTFDLTTMDSQRFVGLSIFGVLPGPLPDTVTFEELVAVARQVAARLGADLQDSRGAPLTSTRVMDLRATFVATDAPATAGGER